MKNQPNLPKPCGARAYGCSLCNTHVQQAGLRFRNWTDSFFL